MARTSQWEKAGKEGRDPEFPGSYGGWTKHRQAPSKYVKTAQQKAVAEAGREVGKVCKGKEGTAFKECRHDVMHKHFG